jgi:V/A-type H+/Na+-transporting ATPase subunit D
MAGVVHAPPGRAGRLWLQHRLSTARHAADLLDHKLRVLRAERQRLALRHERTAAAWEAACRDADRWLVRGVLLGGQRAIRLTVGSEAADVQIAWDQSMGVRYPSDATSSVPRPAPDQPPAANAAMFEARECFRIALEAAVQHAVVEAAVRTVEAQERSTRRRLRAIERRWTPRLQESLNHILLRLEEDEHADGARLRWAAARQVGVGRDSLREGRP